MLSSQVSVVDLYKIVGFIGGPFIVIPASLASAESAAESASTKFLSFIETVVELTVVVVPSTFKLPRITTSPESPTGNGLIYKNPALSVVLNVLPSNFKLSTVKEDNPVTFESKCVTTLLSAITVFILVPPWNVSVSVSKSTESTPPASPVIANCVATFATPAAVS